MQIPVLKNEDYELEIMDMGTEGQGIGKIQDFTVFVPDTVIGDCAKVRIVKIKKHFAFGKLIKIIKPSRLRQEAICEVAHQCGGCQLQYMTYTAQLEWKRHKVLSCLEHIGGFKQLKVEPTLGMAYPFNYRNKAQYPIRMEKGKIKIGFFAPRSHHIVLAKTCHIQAKYDALIIEIVRQFLETYRISIYDETTHKGLVRHLMIRTSHYTGEVMVCLVINGSKLPHAEEFVEKLTAIPNVKSIILNYHKPKDNVVLGDECKVLYGKDTLTDRIGTLEFEISPLAFFQVNPKQTEVLYQKALEFADLTGNEIVWDAYCGIGTISLFLAQKAKKVYGVEMIKEAIDNAKANAKRNGIHNTEFFAGKAEEVIPKMYQKGIVADTIVVDPPRKGCDTKLLETLIHMNPTKIVYISCDPATLARDLGYLNQQGGYQVIKVQPVDMFGQTSHVETVVKLSK